MQGWTCDDQYKWQGFISHCQELAEQEAKRVFTIRNLSRTDLQNNAMHKYFELLANRFNDAGLDKMAVLREKAIPVLWTPPGVKEDIWRPAQRAMFSVESTAELETNQVSEVHRVVDRWTAEKFGITEAFPNRHGPEF